MVPKSISVIMSIAHAQMVENAPEPRARGRFPTTRDGIDPFGCEAVPSRLACVRVWGYSIPWAKTKNAPAWPRRRLRGRVNLQAVAFGSAASGGVVTPLDE